jgi:hypothetical protein
MLAAYEVRRQKLHSGCMSSRSRILGNKKYAATTTRQRPKQAADKETRVTRLGAARERAEELAGNQKSTDDKKRSTPIQPKWTA